MNFSSESDCMLLHELNNWRITLKLIIGIWKSLQNFIFQKENFKFQDLSHCKKIFRQKCRNEFNFFSTVSVNKLNAVIELELRFCFFSNPHFMLLFLSLTRSIPRMPSIGELSFFPHGRRRCVIFLFFFFGETWFADSPCDFLFDSLSVELFDDFLFFSVALRKRRWMELIHAI